MPYESKFVSAVLECYGEFKYNDRNSQKMLESSGLTPVFCEEKGLTDDNSKKYTGEWSGTRRHGKGKLVLRDGSIYEGYWLNDMKNGFGRHISSKGDIYLGQWQNNT